MTKRQTGKAYKSPKEEVTTFKIKKGNIKVPKSMTEKVQPRGKIRRPKRTPRPVSLDFIMFT